jgi:hypothetical protein
MKGRFRQSIKGNPLVSRLSKVISGFRLLSGAVPQLLNQLLRSAARGLGTDQNGADE